MTAVNNSDLDEIQATAIQAVESHLYPVLPRDAVVTVVIRLTRGDAMNSIILTQETDLEFLQTIGGMQAAEAPRVVN